MHPDHLLELIRRHSARSRENLQVADRLKSLLPHALQQSKRSMRGSYKGAAAERRALNDQEYIEKIQEYLAVYSEGLEARIQFETHRMLLQAWQSLNALNRVRRDRKFAEPSRPEGS